MDAFQDVCVLIYTIFHVHIITFEYIWLSILTIMTIRFNLYIQHGN